MHVDLPAWLNHESFPRHCQHFSPTLEFMLRGRYLLFSLSISKFELVSGRNCVMTQTQGEKFCAIRRFALCASCRLTRRRSQSPIRRRRREAREGDRLPSMRAAYKSIPQSRSFTLVRLCNKITTSMRLLQGRKRINTFRGDKSSLCGLIQHEKKRAADKAPRATSRPIL